MKKIFIQVFLLCLCFSYFSCAGDSDSGYNDSSTITNKKNIRKQGYLTILVDSVMEKKRDIVAIAQENDAQIIRENIYTNFDGVTEGSFVLKVKATNFGIIVDSLSTLGKVQRLTVDATDLTDEKDQNIDKIELIKQRIADAQKTKNISLENSLTKRLMELEETQEEISNEIIYSYVSLTVEEKIRFIQSVHGGIKIGSSGFYYAVKYTIIILFYLTPIFLFIMLFRLIYAFIRWKWKYLLNLIELKFGKKQKDKIVE